MNVSDSERMATTFEKIGLSLVDSTAKADVIVINACSVRQKAIDRIWGKLNEFEKIKKKRPNRPLYTVLTGCVLPTDRPKFSERFDLYFPMKELPQLPAKLEKIFNTRFEQVSGKKKKHKIIKLSVAELLADKQIKYSNGQTPLTPISQSPASQKHYLEIEAKYSNKFSAFVPIMTGCNAFCTYCAVPYTRGREVSRKPEEIIDEVARLSAQGYREVTLLGQIINKYMVKIDDTFLKYLDYILSKHGVAIKDIPELQEPVLLEKKLFKFHHLLAVLASLGNDFWLRYVSSHPKWFSRELIDTINRYENIVEHVHLPVQAGSDSTLKRMLRPYTIEEYKKIIIYIREHIPGVALTTDVIVGFCGETEAEFQATKDLFKWAKYDMAYISQYSTRPGTTAQSELADDVSHNVKVKRETELNDILEQTALENNQMLLNEEAEVLVTKLNAKDNKIIGRTRTNKNIRLATSNKKLKTNDLIGKFVKAKVTSITPWSLEGEIKT